MSGGPVAVKVISGAGTREAERFAREAKVLADLRHPRIVKYIAHGVTPEAERYLAMEWLEGEDLAQKLRRGPLLVDETLSLATGVASALAAAHARGVVHRDVKPGNIFLPDGDVGRAKVLDFGLARLADGARRFSLTGVLMGTPAYVAPEQARGARDVEPAADVFALGCVMFECLTGRAAFVGEHIMAVLAKILLDEPPRVSELLADVSPGVDALVGRMMAKAPEDRPVDGAQVEALVHALVDEASGERSKTPSGRYRPRSLTRDERRLVSVVLAGRAKLRADDEDQLKLTTPTVSLEEEGGSLHRVRTAALAMGVRLERLADGTLVAALEGRGNAADQAAAAARCALALRAELPSVPMVLATGRGVLAGRLPVGDVIDGAVKLLRQEAAAHAPGMAESISVIRLDQVTAGLLEAQFEVGVDAVGLVLRRERTDAEAARTLLGRPTPCVGRERELSVLEGLWDECVAEPMARAVLVTAPAGVGKTRLRAEFLRRLRERGKGVEPWIARADSMGAGATYDLLGQIARRALGVNPTDALADRRIALRTAVAEHVPASERVRVVQFLAELASVPLPDDETVKLRAARRDPVVLGDQVRRAWDDFLASACAAHPVLIVLEDLQWGDLPTVQVIDGSLRLLAEAPLFVLALARPEVHAQFPSLWSERAVQEIRLGELSRRASERLVRQVLGEHTPPEVVERLVAQAAGHAFFLEELIRAEAARREAVSFEGTDVTDVAALAAVAAASDVPPGTVIAMLQTRLEALGAEPRRLLRAAAVFGQVFTLAGVRALLGEGGALGHDLLSVGLDELVEREIIVRAPGRGDAEPAFAFRHALVREAAYAMLTDVDRALGHRLAAGFSASRSDVEPLAVAEHYERGGQLAAAAPWYHRAAAGLLAGNDLSGAIARAEQCARCGADEQLLAATRLVQAEAYYWRASYAEAEAAAAASLSRTPPGTADWYVTAGVSAAASGNLGHTGDLRALAETLLRQEPAPPPDGALVADAAAVPRALPHEPSVPNPAAAPRTIAFSRAAVYLLFSGMYAEADRLLEALVARGVDERDPVAAGWWNAARATRAMGTDSGEALVRFTAAVASFDAAGDVRNAALNRINAAFASMGLGAYKSAERALRAAIAPAERMGLQNVVALAENNLGMVLCRLGLLAEALTVASDALAAFAAQGDKRLESGSHAYLAQIRVALGDPAVAEADALAAIAAAEQHPPARAYALAVLADVRLAAGDRRGALAAAAQSDALLTELGFVDDGESYIRLTWARALAAVGRTADAAAAAQLAHNRLLERAALIADATWRRSFLDDVPENLATRRLVGTVLPI